MADVQTTPEVETIPVTKTVEGKVVEETTEVVEETTVTTNGVHTNGETNGDASIEDDDAVKTNGETVNGVEDVAVNGEAEAEAAAPAEGATEEAPATETAAEVVAEEEPKEEEPAPIPTVKLHQFPVGKEIPSTSPFCLKVETFLRINGIPYESTRGYKMGKKGKLPWIEYNGERTYDSKFILEYLRDKFEANLDGDLTDEQIAVGRSVTCMLEENTYWTLIYNRYVDQFNEYKKFMAQGPGGIGFNVSQKMFQRKMRSNLDGHGMGRHLKEEVYKIAEGDLNALSTVLGEKEFLLGDKISSFDCAVFGLCANILYSGMDNPLKTYISENTTNISNLCDKIKETYWSDWDDLLVGEKAGEPALKKGFSFRKKKAKAAKTETATDGSEDAASDEPASEGTGEEKPAEETEATPTATEEKAEDAEAPTEETPAADKPAEPTTETTETTEVKETTNETTEPVTEGTSETTEPSPEA